MGELNIKAKQSAEELREFTKHLLNDVNALEKMIKDDLFEKDVRRIGAEQELFLVDDKFRPSPKVMEILDEINDEHYTNEIAKFNIEFNLDPLDYTKSCLSQLEKDINTFITKGRKSAKKFNTDFAMIGILPTLRQSDLALDNMSPYERYFALNDIIRDMRGEDYRFRVKGIDELQLIHDSVMLEACNTSFQLHFQVSPNNFAKYYNFAQAITAPVLAASVNSPMLFGRRLWQETRIAIFQQAVDTRGSNDLYRDRHARVSFGNKWVKDSVLELFREDISRFRVFFGMKVDENPFEVLKAGGSPKLKALQLHNGTVYRWNRPCYGIFNGKPHIRIENRVIPSGPTPLDATANAAFYYGLMGGISREYEDITKHMDFDDAHNNFIKAARLGLEAQFSWIGKKNYSAKELILKELIPLARNGLMNNNINSADIDKYLGVIEKRVKTGRNGSTWILQSYKELRKHTSKDSILASLTAAAIDREKSGKAVHEWKTATKEDIVDLKVSFMTVEQFMTTDIYTVHEDDLIDFGANLMKWQYIRHVLVEDSVGKLVGVLSYRHIIKQFIKMNEAGKVDSVMVKDVMNDEPKFVSADTTTIDALNLMQENRISTLAVCDDQGRIIGIVREADFMSIASKLMIERLKDKKNK